ncbi:MAG: hypothetical protein HYT08_02100 [Candidatus Levybacteria bacterium]|nr:hypothetical protein [Candidatus Levybacteria bacterium]
MGNKDAIFKTLVYSDIFDYPLKKNEIYEFLIGKKKSQNSFNKLLYSTDYNAFLKGNYYCLLGRESIIKKRIQREKESESKLKIAQSIIKKISFFPTILLIGISGALAMKNADKNDDIDLFIITKENTLWISRIFLILILKLMGSYREREDSDINNKICLNMFVSKDQMTLNKKRQNLYSAHEIVQMLPVFQRNNTYEQFLKANTWIARFLPNSLKGKRVDVPSKNDSFITFLFVSVLHLLHLEFISKKIQLYFINKHKTIETISDTLLAFHPIDYNKQTILRFEERLKIYEKI